MAAWLGLGLIIFPYAVHARVGETQEAIEHRLLQPGLGKLYPRLADSPKDNNKDSPKDNNKDGNRERPKKKDEDPLADIRPFLPGDTHEMFYWKSAVANQLSNETGWKIDVLYFNGHSALEAYKRVGDTLSEFEIRGILSVNRGASSWKKIVSDGVGVSGIGYDYQLEDGSMRAKLQDNWIIVFSTKLDNYIVQQQQSAKAANDLLQEQQKRQQALKAPESISGF